MGVVVVGIDLALASTGVARVEADEQGGTWRTWQVASVKHGSGTVAQAARVTRTAGRIVAAITTAGPVDLVVIEGMPAGTKQQGVRDVAGLWWRVVCAVVELDIPLAVCMPSTLKVYAVGHGGSQQRRVEKPEILAAAQAMYPGALTGGIHDVADALLLAGAGARWLGQPVDCVTDAQLRAIDSIKWPERFRRNEIGDHT